MGKSVGGIKRLSLRLRLGTRWGGGRSRNGKARLLFPVPLFGNFHAFAEVSAAIIWSQYLPLYSRSCSFSIIMVSLVDRLCCHTLPSGAMCNAINISSVNAARAATSFFAASSLALAFSSPFMVSGLTRTSRIRLQSEQYPNIRMSMTWLQEEEEPRIGVGGGARVPELIVIGEGGCFCGGGGEWW